MRHARHAKASARYALTELMVQFVEGRIEFLLDYHGVREPILHLLSNAYLIGLSDANETLSAKASPDVQSEP